MISRAMKAGDRTASDLERLKRICRVLPEATVEERHQHTAFIVRDKKFAWHLVDHHGDGRVALECKAPPGENTALVASEPERFFLPPYMADHGWIGVDLDAGTIDWHEMDELLTEAYSLIAPRRLVARLRALQES